MGNILRFAEIIPYQELRGNYNRDSEIVVSGPIIPYQELRGNYNAQNGITLHDDIIPYQELRGNYNIAEITVALEYSLIWRVKRAMNVPSERG